MSSLAYEIVDVFTERPFAGNPLAVVFDAQALAADQMQSIAREFNLSETVFVLPATRAGASYRARIFTPVRELPFAGHPSVGAAVAAVRRGLCPPGQLIQECGAGLLPLEVSVPVSAAGRGARTANPTGRDIGGSATLTGGTPMVGAPLDPAPLLEIVGLARDDFAGPAPRMAGCGLDFPYLSLRPGSVGRAAIDSAAATRLETSDISVFSWDAEERVAHARVFVPGAGVPEDPATGSAALGLGVWLVASGLLPGEGTSSYAVRQGVEINRPSSLACTVTAANGAAVGATVTGRVVPIARGEIAVPPFVG